MEKKILFAIVALCAFLTNCAFNVEEQIRTVTLRTGSAGLSTVSLKGDGFETNDISVRGIAAESCIVDMSVRRLALQGEQWAQDRLRLFMDDRGAVTYRYSGDDWSAVTISGLEMAVDRGKAVDIGVVTGDITITAMRGFATVTSTTGDVSVETAAGCRIQATTGDIVAKILADTAATDGVTITVTTGDIVVRVPAGFKARLECKTTTGSIKRPSGSEQSSLNAGGAGDPLIKCTSTTGDVTIAEY
jgi:hypothetical protein